LGQNIIEMALLLRIFPNPAKVSGSGGIFAEPDFCRIWKKTPDSDRSRNPVQPYIFRIVLAYADVVSKKPRHF